MSRPRLSVPIQCTTERVAPSSPRTVRSAPGYLLRATGSMRTGSPVARMGASTATTTMIASTAPPKIMLRFTRTSIPDPRIEDDVGEVDEEVDDHVEHREEQDHRLHRRKVAREHRV